MLTGGTSTARLFRSSPPAFRCCWAAVAAYLGPAWTGERVSGPVERRKGGHACMYVACGGMWACGRVHTTYHRGTSESRHTAARRPWWKKSATGVVEAVLPVSACGNARTPARQPTSTARWLPGTCIYATHNEASRPLHTRRHTPTRRRCGRAAGTGSATHLFEGRACACACVWAAHRGIYASTPGGRPCHMLQ